MPPEPLGATAFGGRLSEPPFVKSWIRPRFGIQAIRTQTQMIRTQATGCFVPILLAVEIRFHQPKQCLTVSLVFSGETLNSAKKKSRQSSYTLRRQLHDFESPTSVPYL